MEVFLSPIQLLVRGLPTETEQSRGWLPNLALENLLHVELVERSMGKASRNFRRRRLDTSFGLALGR